MAYSTQRAVSDGTLARMELSIDIIEQSDVNVYYDGVAADPTTWSWESPTSNAILFSPIVPLGVEVLLQRSTYTASVLNIFGPDPTRGGNAKFTNATMDENFRQALFIAQEAKEGSSLTDVYANLDIHGYLVQNSGTPVASTDLANKAYVDALAPGVAAQVAAAQAAASASAGSATASAGSATAAAASATTASAAANSTAVQTVSAHIADITTVAGISTDVHAVGSNVAAVTAIGDDLTGAPIVIDYGSIADAVSNPAAPSGVLGAVYTNAANIATVAGSIDNVNTVAEHIDEFTTPATVDTLGVVKPDGDTITIDETGKISAVGGGGGTVWKGTPNSGTQSTTLTVLESVTIPGGSMGTTSQLRVWALYTFTGSAGNKTMKVFWGAVASGYAVINQGTSNNANAQFTVEGTIANNNSTAAQIVQAGFGTNGGWSGTGSAPYTTTLDTTQDQVINFACSVANGADECILTAYRIELIP